MGRLYGLLLLLFCSACKKELVEDLDPNLPIHKEERWASFTAQQLTTYYAYYNYPQRLYQAQYHRKGQLVKAGVLLADGIWASFLNGHYQGIGLGTPNPDTTVWEAEASEDFPAFTYVSTLPAPQLGRIYSINYASRRQPYELTTSFNIGADSTRFVLGNQRYTTAGSVRSHKFTSKELANAPIGNSTASITAFTYEKVQIEGIWMEFRKEETQRIEVSIVR